MKVFWSTEALQDREDIWNYIAQDNPTAAAEMDALFSAAASLLSEQPFLGKVGKIHDTRELIAHENYRLVYEIHNENIWILTLIHTSRHWPLIRPTDD